MRHVETFYIGCDDDGSRAEPGYAAMQRWCAHTFDYYLPLINNLSKHFLQADLFQEEGSLKGPYRLVCTVPEYMFKRPRYKDADEDTRYERFKWFFNNMLPPREGMIVSVYVNDYDPAEIDSVWTSQYLWRAKEMWSPDTCDNDLITITKIESPQATFKISDADPITHVLHNEVIKLGYTVKVIGYDTSVEETYRTLLKSRMHFGYAGGSYFMASLTRTPTIAFGAKADTMKARVPGKPGHLIPTPYNLWGMAFPNPGHNMIWRDGGTRSGVIGNQSVTDDVLSIDTILDQLLR